MCIISGLKYFLKKKEEKRLGHLTEPALSARSRSPSRGLSPLGCGRPEVPPSPAPGAAAARLAPGLAPLRSPVFV